MAGKSAALLLAFLLMLEIGWSAWNQSVEIQAVSKNGLPASDCDVRIVYQKSDQASRSDGIVEGITDANGKFYANITNSVPEGNDSKRFEVRLSCYYWEGETRAFEAGGEEVQNAKFIVPLNLEEIEIMVLNFLAKPVQGAEISVYGTKIKAWTDANGSAKINMPVGAKFSGFVRKESQSQQFDSQQTIFSASGKRIEVVLLPPSQQSKNNTRVAFGLKAYGSDGMPLSGQQIDFLHSQGNLSVVSNMEGFAEAQVPAGKLEVRINKSEYLHVFHFDVKTSQNQTITLPPLLKIGQISQLPQGKNCYRLSVNVSDPRKELPLKVVFAKTSKNITTYADAEVDDRGVFYTAICIFADTSVKAIASNKYETAETSNISLALQMIDEKPALPKPPTIHAKEEKKQEDYSGWILLFGLLAVLALVMYFARKQLEKPLRFVIGYVRFIHQLIERMKPKKPQEEERQ